MQNEEQRRLLIGSEKFLTGTALVDLFVLVPVTCFTILLAH